MAPLPSGSTINVFDISKAQWDALQLTEVVDGYQPEDRSYHVFTAIQVSSFYRSAIQLA